MFSLLRAGQVALGHPAGLQAQWRSINPSSIDDGEAYRFAMAAHKRGEISGTAREVQEAMKRVLDEHGSFECSHCAYLEGQDQKHFGQGAGLRSIRGSAAGSPRAEPEDDRERFWRVAVRHVVVDEDPLGGARQRPAWTGRTMALTGRASLPAARLGFMTTGVLRPCRTRGADG
jgi:hypothetical protein